MASVVGFLQKLFNRKQLSSLNVTTIGTKEVYVSIDTEKAVSEGYNGNTAVYSIVGKDARKFAAIEQKLYKIGSEEEETLDNDLSKLLNRPNEYEGRSFFREKLRTYYKITGEAFEWLNRGALADTYIDEMGNEVTRSPQERMRMPILERYVLPSDYIEVIRDTTNVWGIEGYNLIVNGQRHYIPKEDILHWKNVNLDYGDSTGTHLRGRSPLASGYKTLQQNNSATDAAVRMYQNDGAKGVLFNESTNDLEPAQKEAAKRMVDRRINSNDVKGAVAMLPGKWGYASLGMSNTDLGLLEGKNISMKELCFLFDVPFEMFDSATTFANKEMAQKNWVYNSIIPACKQYDDECNRMLLVAFGLEGKAIIESDYDDLPEMQEDLVKKVEALMKVPWLTPNQVLEALGYEPFKDNKFNEPWVPNDRVPLSESGLSMDSIAADLAAQGLND